MGLRLKPISFAQACEYITAVHRHHKPPQGHKFSVGLTDESGALRGIVCVGRPVARALDDGYTAEVTRLCTDGVQNGCSALYGAAARAASAMGYTRIVTYILASETGASLKAAGWTMEAASPGGSWSVPSRRRTDSHPLEPKTRWGRTL